MTTAGEGCIGQPAIYDRILLAEQYLTFVRKVFNLDP